MFSNYKCIQTILLSGIILIILDLTYLYINRKEMEIQVAAVQRVNLVPNYTGMVLCYFLLILGLYWFILKKNASVLEAVLFGIVVYGVFETTNYGVFKKWSYKTVVKDILWGGALMGLTTAITYSILRSPTKLV